MAIINAITGVGASAVGMARTLPMTQAAAQAVAVAAHPAAAITPPRKRHRATAIDASVHRGTT